MKRVSGSIYNSRSVDDSSLIDSMGSKIALGVKENRQFDSKGYVCMLFFRPTSLNINIALAICCENQIIFFHDLQLVIMNRKMF